jgi:hypothetical protein
VFVPKMTPNEKIIPWAQKIIAVTDEGIMGVPFNQVPITDYVESDGSFWVTSSLNWEDDTSEDTLSTPELFVSSSKNPFPSRTTPATPVAAPSFPAYGTTKTSKLGHKPRNPKKSAFCKHCNSLSSPIDHPSISRIEVRPSLFHSYYRYA